ncbi:hypothetical protein [Arthrobacter cavernae]|uniref:Uncharacterized protein n=1 Tax=Arthrobacter cavernae TaxID=2817681 RepID=A0A939KL97_9MICC|nr:hypothetical protein [Arthrobacter cavernae]MBO1269714.1 hypothetical protein [Arthrobacter cavernae]
MDWKYPMHCHSEPSQTATGEVLLRPPAPGKYRLTIDLEHWITRRVLARKEIPIIAA